MISRRTGVAIAALTAILAVSASPSWAQEAPVEPAPPATEPAPQAAAFDEAAAQVQQALPAAEVARDDATGQVRFIGAPAGQALTASAGSPEASARALVDLAAPALGVRDPGSQLVVTRTEGTQNGGVAVRFAQHQGGLPVVGGEATVQLDAAGQPQSLLADLTTGASTAAEPPAVSADDAVAAAIEVTARAHPAAGALTAADPELWVYDREVVGWPGLPGARRVWRTEVTGHEGAPVRELVLVDAATGAVVVHFDQIAHARNRQVCDAQNIPAAADRCGTSLPVVRNEIGAPVGLAEVNTAHAYSGDTYDFFFDRFGRDSLDDDGFTLKSTVRHCEPGEPCPFQNAFWSGSQMHYGNGFAGADDVVGHELSHGFTQFTSGLFYYYQSGAINESLSDIFGELIDQTNTGGTDSAGVKWLMGEDVPGGAIRNMASPPAFGDPDRMRSPNYWGSVNDNGGVHVNSGVGNKTAFLMVDGGNFNGQSVAGLGVDKSARIWYEVATAFLTSGSDYRDLDLALVQACTNLVGTGGITAGNCNQVSKATDATQLHLDPVASGAPQEAPVCAAGETANFLMDEDVEGSLNWSTDTTSASPWSAITGYATSGVRSFYTPNTNEDGIADLWMDFSVPIPAGADVYARFAHAHEFEFSGAANYDGGQVHYSKNGGAWTNAGPLFTHNGYNGTVAIGEGNPIAGEQAFVNRSFGYTSSRLDLSSLGGQSVRLRFRVATDNMVAALGWLIDDIQIYTCEEGEPPPPACAAAPFPDVPKNHPFCVDITWLADEGITGGFPDGRFRPTLAVDRQSMAAFLYRMVDPPFTPPSTASFPDVPKGHAFFEEVEWLADSGITGGFPDGSFRPTAPVDRQSMAAFLFRLVDPVFTPPGTASFPDVPQGHAFFEEVEWLASTGITKGNLDGTFGPRRAVDRQSMAAFLHRLADLS